MPGIVKSICQPFADDEQIYSCIQSHEYTKKLHSDLDGFNGVVRKMAIAF